MTGGFGGIFASQAIRLIGKIYSQTIYILYLWGTSAIVSLLTLASDYSRFINSTKKRPFSLS